MDRKELNNQFINILKEESKRKENTQSSNIVNNSIESKKLIFLNILSLIPDILFIISIVFLLKHVFYNRDIYSIKTFFEVSLNSIYNLLPEFLQTIIFRLRFIL